MCLIVFAWQTHPRYKLVLAANRDELHARPAEPMHWWPDRPTLLAGRDLQAGGSWLATAKNGRFATVTNYRERFRANPRKRSRGDLVTDFVSGSDSPADFAAAIDGDAYSGFSLLLTDGREFGYTTNRGDPARRLEPGVYGLSNATLDTPWPKVKRCRTALATLLQRDDVGPTPLLTLLGDTTPSPVRNLDPELPVELARAVSAPFIKNERYGTRCSTALLVDHDGNVLVCERRFDAAGRQSGEQQFRFTADTRLS